MSLVVNPYSYFTDTNGNALNGYLYVGEVGKYAENYPIAIFYDALFTTPAPNPLTVSAGYIYNSGTIAQIYTSADYSIVVKKTDGSLVYSSLNETGMTNGAIANVDEMKDFVALYDNYALNVLGYSEAGDGGGGVFYYDANSTEDDNGGTIIEPTSGSGRWIRVYDFVKLEYFGVISPDYVLDSNWIWDSTIDKSTANLGTIIDPSVALDAQGTGSGLGCMVRQYSGAVNAKWFGAKGDGVTDDTVALQSAIDYCQANTNRTLIATKCTFLVSSSIHIGCYIKFKDSAIVASSSFASNGTVVYIELGGQRLDGLSVVGSAYHISNNITGVNIGDCPSLRYGYNAYEICSYNLYISNFAVGLSISTFQNKYYSTVIVDCATGISMYGIGNSREINLNSFFGGNIRGCIDYALYLGDTRQPNCRTDGEAQGSSNAFYDMQFIGSIAIGFVSSTNIHNCNFEYANYGNQIAINLYRTYELDIKNPFFNGYKYGVKEVRTDVDYSSSISITTPTYNGVSICGVYTISDLTFVSYEGGTNIGSFGNGAEFHFGQRTITAGTLANVRKLVSTSLGSIGIVPSTDTYTFPRSFIRDGAYKSYEYLSNDYVIKNISTSIGGTLDSYFLTVPIASVVGLTSGVYLTTTSPSTMFGVISNINYETGVISVIDFYSATPVSTNTSTFKPVQLSTHFGSAAPTTGYYEQGSKVYKYNATAGDFIGWVCTSSGTPGTWKTFGAISA